MNCLLTLFPHRTKAPRDFVKGWNLNCYTLQAATAVPASKQLLRSSCSLVTAEGIPWRCVHSSKLSAKADIYLQAELTWGLFLKMLLEFLYIVLLSRSLQSQITKNIVRPQANAVRSNFSTPQLTPL